MTTKKKIYKNNGLLGGVDGNSGHIDVIKVYSCGEIGEGFHTDQIVIFLDPITGLRVAGPVTVLTFDCFSGRLVLSSLVHVRDGDAIYIYGSQSETGPPVV